MLPMRINPFVNALPLLGLWQTQLKKKAVHAFSFFLNHIIEVAHNTKTKFQPNPFFSC